MPWTANDPRQSIRVPRQSGLPVSPLTTSLARFTLFLLPLPLTSPLLLGGAPVVVPVIVLSWCWLVLFMLRSPLPWRLHLLLNGRWALSSRGLNWNWPLNFFVSPLRRLGMRDYRGALLDGRRRGRTLAVLWPLTSFLGHFLRALSRWRGRPLRGALLDRRRHGRTLAVLWPLTSFLGRFLRPLSR